MLFDKNHTTLIELPTGLKGSYAIPDGVTTVGAGAFFLCNGLTSVTMTASVTTLDDSAFADCSGLTTITLGAGVNQIVYTALGGCNQLTAINVDPANPVLSSINGVVYDKSQTALIKFPTGFRGNYTAPGSSRASQPMPPKTATWTALRLPPASPTSATLLSKVAATWPM